MAAQLKRRRTVGLTEVSANRWQSSDRAHAACVCVKLSSTDFCTLWIAPSESVHTHIPQLTIANIYVFKNSQS